MEKISQISAHLLFFLAQANSSDLAVSPVKKLAFMSEIDSSQLEHRGFTKQLGIT